MDHRQLLKCVEQFLDEFYDSRCGNERKHEIESQLKTFSDQYNSCDIFIYFLTNSNNQYVLLYSLSVLEQLIQGQWNVFSSEQRDYYRNTLYSSLINNNVNTPNFLRKKLAKIIVRVAFHEFPNQTDDIITNIKKLLKLPETELVGLIILRTASEELTSDKIELNSSKRLQLLKHWQCNIPDLFDILRLNVDKLIDKPSKHFTNPPPSPTQPTSLQTETQIQNFSLLPPNNKDITRETLLTFQHLFTWVSLTSITAPLLNGIFYFAKVNGFSQADDNINVLAISTLNEILYRKCFPPDSHYLFVLFYENVFNLLCDVIDSKPQLSDNLGLEFYEKLTELLSLILSQQLVRLEGLSVDVNNFLVAFLHYTFVYPEYSAIRSSLQIWDTIIKQLKCRITFEYSTVFQDLVQSILNTIETSFNETNWFDKQSTISKHLDNNDNDNDEDQNDYKSFVKQCGDTLELLGERLPSIISYVLNKWVISYEVYLTFDKTIRNILNDNVSWKKLCSFLKVFSTFTILLGRLGSGLIERISAKGALNEPIEVNNVVAKLISIIDYSNKVKFYEINLNEDSKSFLKNCFIELHSELIHCLKTWCKLFYNSNDLELQTENLVSITIGNLLNMDTIPSNIVNSSSQLFFFVTTFANPPKLLENRAVLDLVHLSPKLDYQNAHKEIKKVLSSSTFHNNNISDLVKLMNNIRRKVEEMYFKVHLQKSVNVVHQAVCNILMRSWSNVSAEVVVHQHSMLVEFFNLLTKSFNNLNGSDCEVYVERIVASSIHSLISILDYYKYHSTNTKKMLFTGVQASVEHSLKLFPLFANNIAITDHILSLFLTLLAVFKQQLSVEFIKHSVTIFLDVAMSEQRSNDLSGFNKLLQILQIIVAEPSTVYKSFLPDILTLCLHHVRPIVFQKSSQNPDLAIAFYSLLHSILLHRWQYFYKSQIKMGMSPSSSENNPEFVENVAELQMILEAFGQALLQADINIFKISLSFLENLNSTWKLYSKLFFKTQLLNQFLTVLFQTLLQKTHVLLKEEVIVTIYNMAAVDFGRFFEQFFPYFLSTMSNLRQEQREELKTNFYFVTDLPTLVQNVEHFMNDSFYYQTMNQRN